MSDILDKRWFWSTIIVVSHNISPGFSVCWLVDAHPITRHHKLRKRPRNTMPEPLCEQSNSNRVPYRIRPSPCIRMSTFGFDISCTFAVFSFRKYVSGIQIWWLDLLTCEKTRYSGSDWQLYIYCNSYLFLFIILFYLFIIFIILLILFINSNDQNRVKIVLVFRWIFESHTIKYTNHTSFRVVFFSLSPNANRLSTHSWRNVICSETS